MPASHSKKDNPKQIVGVQDRVGYGRVGSGRVGGSQIELQQALTSSALSSTHSITYVSSVKYMDAGENDCVDKREREGEGERREEWEVELDGVKEQLQLQLPSRQTCEKLWKNC